MDSSDRAQPSSEAPTTELSALVQGHGATVIGGYRVDAPIGAGGQAAVYRALDLHLQRYVALKVLAGDASPHARERFLREVRLIAAFQHPHIVMLYAAGEDRGQAWAAMELLPGSLAQELTRRGRLPPADVVRIGREAAFGLDAAAARGIVHRDVKPSNLLRTDTGAVKVADFGLAKDLGADLHLTAPDVALGTPLYVSPEQASGRGQGIVSDIYSLGATLYHLVAGRTPFQSANALDVIVRHAVEPVPPLPADVPARLARLIVQMLAKEPARRPQTYGEIIAVMDAIADGTASSDEVALGATGAAPAGTGSTLVAAARAALELGRHSRVQTLLAPVVERREAGWVAAAFVLAKSREQDGDLTTAEHVLDTVAQHAEGGDERAYALWSLGRLAERQSSIALQRAIDVYRRIGDLSSGVLPKTLIDARISELRRRVDARVSGAESKGTS